LCAKRGKGHEDIERGDYLDRNKKRTDVRLFLTQRSIQSFIHLLLETRDPHTVRWIEVMNSAREACEKVDYLGALRQICCGANEA
jgi:hypothetical protein